MRIYRTVQNTQINYVTDGCFLVLKGEITCNSLKLYMTVLCLMFVKNRWLYDRLLNAYNQFIPGIFRGNFPSKKERIFPKTAGMTVLYM